MHGLVRHGSHGLNPGKRCSRCVDLAAIWSANVTSIQEFHWIGHCVSCQREELYHLQQDAASPFEGLWCQSPAGFVLISRQDCTRPCFGLWSSLPLVSTSVSILDRPGFQACVAKTNTAGSLPIICLTMLYVENQSIFYKGEVFGVTRRVCYHWSSVDCQCFTLQVMQSMQYAFLSSCLFLNHLIVYIQVFPI